MITRNKVLFWWISSYEGRFSLRFPYFSLYLRFHHRGEKKISPRNKYFRFFVLSHVQSLDPVKTNINLTATAFRWWARARGGVGPLVDMHVRCAGSTGEENCTDGCPLHLGACYLCRGWQLPVECLNRRFVIGCLTD